MKSKILGYFLILVIILSLLNLDSFNYRSTNKYKDQIMFISTMVALDTLYEFLVDVIDMSMIINILHKKESEEVDNDNGGCKHKDKKNNRNNKLIYLFYTYLFIFTQIIMNFVVLIIVLLEYKMNRWVMKRGSGYKYFNEKYKIYNPRNSIDDSFGIHSGG